MATASVTAYGVQAEAGKAAGPDADTVSFAQLLERVHRCTLCAEHLPLGPNPVLQIHPRARLLIVGQAPGRKVHESGIPFSDASGDRLREWMGISRAMFYNPERVAILPMGFCYPGSGKNGDLPPRPECAPAWRAQLLTQLKDLRLTLIIGRYAHAYHLPGARQSVTTLVQSWRQYAPALIPLPHPSPRNNIWLRRNPWFESELLVQLRELVAQVLSEQD